MSPIGTYQETSLHAALKQWYAQPDDRMEEQVDGSVIDLVRGDLLIEIQTANFSAIRRKLERLVEAHPVRLVYPIPQEKWITRLSADGSTRLGRRKSPRHGRVEHLFLELVHLPHLVIHPHFSLEVLMIQEEDLWREDGQGSWRRKGRSIHDRQLLSVLSRVTYSSPGDYVSFVPANLPQLFTVRELSESIRQPQYLAAKMVYCLRKMGVVEVAGKHGRALVYQKAACPAYLC
jgi:hypothetical protein